MKILVQVLIFLAIVAFLVGTVMAFCSVDKFILSREGYWRGSMGLLGFAIAAMLYLSTFYGVKK